MEDIIISFDVGGMALSITQSSIRKLNSIVKATVLHKLSLEDVYAELMAVSVEGMIEKSTYLDFILKKLVYIVDKSSIMATFGELFDAFDHGLAMCVDAYELIVGTVVLCNGNKSTKLAFAFDMIDSDGDGLLTHRDLWRFYRSIICTLMIISSTLPFKQSHHSALNQASLRVVSSIHEYVNRRSIRFHDIAKWYTAVGYNTSSFIELLDLHKWLPFSGAIREFEIDENSLLNFFEISLARQQKIVFNHGHCDLIKSFSRITKLDSIDCFDLFRILKCYSDDFNCVTSEAFKMFTVDNFEDAVICSELLKLFNFLDEGKKNKVLLPVLACGISIMCNGSKSHKLSMAFQLWESDDEGFIHISDLVRLLNSYLTIFYMISNISDFYSSSFADMDTVSVLRETATNVCHLVSSYTKSQFISFESFGNWYNHTGYLITPWLELLNIQKWDISSKIDFSKSIDANEDDLVAFSVLILSEPDSGSRVHTVSKASAKGFYNLSKAFNFSPDSVYAFITSSVDGLLSREAFNHLCAVSFSEFTSSDDSNDTIYILLRNFYNMFDRSGDGDNADAVDVAIGLLILSEGSKSVKLATAFDILDVSKIGCITKRDIWRLLRALLGSIIAVDCTFSGISVDTMLYTCDSSSLWLSDSIQSSNDSGITFDDIAEWYQNIGCKVCSWLELLDKNKWQFFISL